MHELNCDIERAMAWAAEYHSEVEIKFMDALKRVPSWGPIVDEQLGKYIAGIANWPRANVCWSFEGKRHFGDKGLEIQLTRRVPLLPKFERDDNLRGKDVIVPEVGCEGLVMVVHREMTKSPGHTTG